VKEGPIVKEQVRGQGKLAQRGSVVSRGGSSGRLGRSLALGEQGVFFI